MLKEQYKDGTNLDARVALHMRFSTATRAFHDWLFDYVDAPADARILEVGCGTGQMWRTVRVRVPQTWRLVLTDFSFGMASGLRNIVETLYATSLQCDAQALPFSDAHFDAVIANHMLYHVPDLPRALADIRRVLTVGGILIAATNGEAHMRELTELRRACDIGRANKWSLTFTLDNGADWLAPHFALVERHDFADALRVTEVEPLVAYICSMSAMQVDDEKLARLRVLAAERIARDVAIHIRKEAGLFVATKGVDT